MPPGRDARPVVGEAPPARLRDRPATADAHDQPVAATAQPATALPLRRGASGDPVQDLQLRLVRLGLSTGDDRTSEFGDGTEAAVRSFQRHRGLRVDGICGRQTWSGIVEAGWQLGDRVLYHRTPMLHGDDVADLQRRLSALGFDPHGVDGIFGDVTLHALVDFQRNAGLSGDGICGPLTIAELNRLTTRPGGEDLVTAVRERLRAASRSATLAGKQIAIGEYGGFSTVVRAINRVLASRGVTTLDLHHPDESEQAAAANDAAVECYIAFRLDPSHSSVRTNYYRGYRYESETARRLAEILLEALIREVGLEDGGAHGMAFPILRETRMAAVVVELGAPGVVAMRTAQIARAVRASLEQWMMLDWELTH